MGEREGGGQRVTGPRDHVWNTCMECMVLESQCMKYIVLESQLPNKIVKLVNNIPVSVADDLDPSERGQRLCVPAVLCVVLPTTPTVNFRGVK